MIHSATTVDGTIHEAIFKRITAVDIETANFPSAIMCASNGLRDTHCAIHECHVARTVGEREADGTVTASNYHSFVIS